jgi:microcystin-dependent protein
MDDYLAEIRLFAGNFAPYNWAFCNGQLLSISDNSALFSLIGTTYGGDGITTFALPDLQSRVPICTGQGPGLSNRILGERSGNEAITLLTNQIPNHNHPIAKTTTTGTDASSNTFVVGAPGGTAQTSSSGNFGGTTPHSNMQPYTGLNYIICVEGIYPSRS